MPRRQTVLCTAEYFEITNQTVSYCKSFCLFEIKGRCLYMINTPKYLYIDIKSVFMGNEVYWGNGAATPLRSLSYQIALHLTPHPSELNLFYFIRKWWQKTLGTLNCVVYQTTKILAEVKMIMYHVKIGQDLCASASRQALPISVICGHTYSCSAFGKAFWSTPVNCPCFSSYHRVVSAQTGFV